MSWRSVTAHEASYTPGFFTRPETEYMRVPPSVLVPRPANHSAPRLMMGGTQKIVSTLFTMVGAPKAPLIAGNGGLNLGQLILPTSDVRLPCILPTLKA